MADNAITKPSPADVPPPPPDAENPAILDAEKTFKVTVLTAIVFALCAAFIIFRTRMG